MAMLCTDALSYDGSEDWLVVVALLPLRVQAGSAVLQSQQGQTVHIAGCCPGRFVKGTTATLPKRKGVNPISD